MQSSIYSLSMGYLQTSEGTGGLALQIAVSLSFFLAEADHLGEAVDGLLFVTLVEQSWIQLDVGEWLQLAGLDHITLSFLGLVGITRKLLEMASVCPLL